MKRLFKFFGNGFVSIFLITWTGSASADVANSKHNLSGQTTATDEVCVFCHTPHGSNSDPTAKAPLWNKVVTPGTYTQYSTTTSTTFDSKTAPVGSVSLACLSCHDGTQAMDVVLNAPGSGGYTGTGAEIDTGIGIIGQMAGTPIPNLEADLTNDHPVSMQYGGGGPLATDPDGQYTGNLGDIEFTKPQKDTINNAPVWWVDTPSVGLLGTREKTDMLLYARDDRVGGPGVLEPFVECGSCHDPHNETTGTTGVEFLRVANTGSQVCRACHIK